MQYVHIKTIINGNRKTVHGVIKYNTNYFYVALSMDTSVTDVEQEFTDRQQEIVKEIQREPTEGETKVFRQITFEEALEYAFPSPAEQLWMQFQDAENATNTWQTTIATIRDNIQNLT